MSHDYSKPPGSQPSMRRFLMQLIASTLLINLFLVVVAGWSLRHSWLQHEEQIAVNTENLSLVLERYLNGVIEKIDLTLVELKEDVEPQLARGHIDPLMLNRKMARQLARLPELYGLRIADSEGNLLYGTDLPAGKPVRIADLEFFHSLRKTPREGMVISPPILSQISGRRVVIVGRVLNGPAGSFGGAVYGIISLDYFTRLFSTINVGRKGAITVWDGDLRVIARYVPGADTSKTIGKKLFASEWKKLLKEGRTSGTFRTTVPMDNIDRTVSFRKVGGYPLFVSVARARDEFFAEWRHTVAKITGIVTCFVIASFVYSYLLFRRRKSEKKAEEELHLYHDYLEDMVKERTAEVESRNKALEESEGLLRVIFDNIYDGIVIHDREGRILQVNQQFLKMHGVTEQEAKSMTIIDLSADPWPNEEFYTFWGDVLSGNSKFFEWRSRRPHDGSVFDVEVFICPITLSGQNLVMGAVRDITERKLVAQELQKYRDELEFLVKERTEELAKAVEETKCETEQRLRAVEELRVKERLLIQQSRLAAMGEMLGNIAHQWRQPLNILGLVVQELKFSYHKGVCDEELLDVSVAKAMQVIRHMSQTIDDFRNLLSPDKASVTFSINEVVEKVLSMMHLQAKVDLLAEEECFMDGGRNEYSQVIINIINNARDVFVERKVQDPRIIIRIKSENGRAVVTIADNGGGIADEIIEKIFDPYFTTKGPDRGTGIGLFMSKNIIEQSMKGTLTVSNTAEGAEFRIETLLAAMPGR